MVKKNEYTSKEVPFGYMMCLYTDYPKEICEYAESVMTSLTKIVPDKNKGRFRKSYVNVDLRVSTKKYPDYEDFVIYCMLERVKGKYIVKDNVFDTSFDVDEVIPKSKGAVTHPYGSRLTSFDIPDEGDLKMKELLKIFNKVSVTISWRFKDIGCEPFDIPFEELKGYLRNDLKEKVSVHWDYCDGTQFLYVTSPKGKW